jgi:hypothetical protein
MSVTLVSHRPRGTLSIRTLVYGAIIGLSALSLGALGVRVTSEFSHLRDVQAAQEANIGATRFTAGLFEVLMERLETNNALQATAPAGEAVLQGIARRRAAVAANFAPGLAVLSQRGFRARRHCCAISARRRRRRTSCASGRMRR